MNKGGPLGILLQWKMRIKGRLMPGLTKNTFLLAATSFFGDISTEMLYPVMPIFLTTVIGAPVSIVGIVQGMAEGTQYIVQGLAGWLADKFRSKKPLALFGYALSAVAKPVMGISITWPEVLVGRFAERLGAGTRSAPRDALIAASVEGPLRGQAFGVEGIGDNLGAVVGPLATILLIYSFNTNLRTIFYIALVPGLLALLMMALVKEERRKIKIAEQRKSAVKALPKSFWKYVAIIFIFGIGNSSNAFLILRARNLGFSVESAILLYAMFNLVAAVSSYPAGFLADKLGRRWLLLGAMAIAALTYTGFAIGQNVLAMAVLFVLYGGYQGIFRTVSKTAAAEFVPAEQRATGLGVFSAMVGLTTLFASILAGQLWVRINPSSAFIFGAEAAAAASVVLLFYWPKPWAEAAKS